VITCPRRCKANIAKPTLQSRRGEADLAKLTGKADMAKKQRPKPKVAATSRRRMHAPLGRTASRAVRVPIDLRACEQFLLHEARLLDDARFDDWLALFTPDAWYWVPSEPDQADPHETVSLIYDDRRLLETRVRRLASPRMYSQEPRSRTSRVVANVSIEAAERGAATVRAKFVMIEFRRDSQRLFGGTTLHRLVATEHGLRIAWKRVNLVNCDAPMDGITVPF
jgi:3-phenylpropionate/cinnamic acid dioxygenase small subunit